MCLLHQSESSFAHWPVSPFGVETEGRWASANFSFKILPSAAVFAGFLTEW